MCQYKKVHKWIGSRFTIDKHKRNVPLNLNDQAKHGIYMKGIIIFITFYIMQRIIINKQMLSEKANCERLNTVWLKWYVLRVIKIFNSKAMVCET